MTNKNKLKKKLQWQIRKYSRWLRLYRRRVRIVEKELNGNLDAI